jgi:GT2 family glycosyltransferase
MATGTSYLFGCLLPVKIEADRLSGSQRKYLMLLAESMSSHKRARCRVFVGVDNDKQHTVALSNILDLFCAYGIPSSVIFFERSNAGQICTYWRILADAAVKEGCDFFGLLGDDVEIHTGDWVDEVVKDFEDLHRDLGLPDELFGFGCIALNDRQAPGFPTFPILHRVHYALNGELFGKEFVNQDADPFIFQLYRRWGASRFASVVALTNHIGGVELAEDTAFVVPRYDRKHIEWSNTVLSEAVKRIELKNIPCAKYITVDVVVPTYRVTRDLIERICSLKCCVHHVSVQFIIVVDDPFADVAWLKELATKRFDVRVRINPVNCGASHTRNVGMDESAAEFILFLDDDVIPEANVIDEYVLAVQQHGDNHDGFVGFSDLPEMLGRVFPTAVHFSGVSFFWRAAQKMELMPWGITANLFVRRAESPRFDVRYIKTGGGEDIDFCLKLKRQPLRAVPRAVVVHPWWDNGARCYWHFFNWAQSDGMLQDVYPHLCYRNFPDAMETCLIVLSGAAALHKPRMGVFMCSAVLLTDVVMDFYELWPDTSREPYSTGVVRVLAVLESTLIKNASCVGRLWGHAKRWRIPRNICKRFDWFCGLIPEVVAGEKSKALKRFACFVAVVASVLALAPVATS